MVTDGRTNPFYAVVRDDGLNFVKNPKGISIHGPDVGDVICPATYDRFES